MKKLFLSIIALTLSAGLWAQNSTIFYTATYKIYPGDMNECVSNITKRDEIIDDYPELQEYRDNPIEFWQALTDKGINFFATDGCLDANGQFLECITYGHYPDKQGFLQFSGDIATINYHAFNLCPTLTSVIIPNSVTSIRDEAFSWCTQLADVYVSWTKSEDLPTLGEEVFEEVDDITLHVPAGTKAIYEAADQWKDFGRIVEVGKDLTIEDFKIEIPDYNIYNGDPYTATVALKEGVTGAGEITVTYKQGETEVASPINVGDYDIYVSVTEGSEYNALPETKIGKLSIWQASYTFSDFTFTAPENLEYDGNEKVATIVFDDKGGKRTGSGEISVKYNDSTQPPIEPGDYTVSIDITEGLNYVALIHMTSDDWKFTITISLEKVKAAAIAEITTTRKGIQNTNLNNRIDGAMSDIQQSTTKEEIDRIKNEILDVINIFQDGKAEALGNMGEPCEDCPAIEVSDGTTTVTLYNPKNVQFKKTQQEQ